MDEYYTVDTRGRVYRRVLDYMVRFSTFQYVRENRHENYYYVKSL